MTKTSTLKPEHSLSAVKTIHRGTDLQRRYREVLDSAYEAPVALVDKADRRLVVAAWERFEFADSVVRILDAIAKLHAIHSLCGDRPATEWADLTEFPFLEVFDADDVAQFIDEQIPCLEECMRHRDLTAYFGNLRAWESSAETYNNEKVLEQMYAPDEDVLPELFPSER